MPVWEFWVLDLLPEINPGRVLDYKLEQVREAALPSTETDDQIRTGRLYETVEFGKENANEIKEYDWSVWYTLDRQAAVKWKRTSDEYAKFIWIRIPWQMHLSTELQLCEKRMSSKSGWLSGEC